MKLLLSLLLSLLSSLFAVATGYIRINQLGYLPHSVKVAVYISSEKSNFDSFEIVEAISGELVFKGKTEKANALVWGQQTAYRLDFSDLIVRGGYRIRLGDLLSEPFRIDEDVFKGSADFILQYMRQQRCGFNPYFRDSCHTHDGLIVDHPTRTGEWIDVKGGWHDASDYLQYTTTSANATYQMLFAYQQNPEAFGDSYDSNGLPVANGIADIIDEARWGLNWLLKMNPAKNEMYNQIADDRDHIGMRLPVADSLGGYGLGKFRPVYYVTGKSQGLGKYKNRSTGVSSTAAKFASSFALGARIFKDFDTLFAKQLNSKSLEAWRFAKSDLGNFQTACMVSPYFYEEDNYVDDMELAAVTLGNNMQSVDFLKQAAYWGELEPVTPWMELNRARHYQYYPFVNLGHVLLAQSSDSLTAQQFKGLLKQGLEHLIQYGEDDPFRIGVPFIWCSNNLVVAAATQARLYREITGDGTYKIMEAALIDWLFGCNPWGTSMICGLPAGGDYPENPHSSLTYFLRQNTVGGLVDGPVYASIFKNLIGIKLHDTDEYHAFQEGKAVYHDDMGDYSTNEPTMDGTASLSYLLSALESETLNKNGIYDRQGALVRNQLNEKKVYLIFSAHEFNDGGRTIQETLLKHESKASFFFTGKFYENPENNALILSLIKDGHYLGAHSDHHLLYASWEKRDSTLISKSALISDLKANYLKMAAFGIRPEKAITFLPPYEWYNAETLDWASQMGLKLINFTPGIRSNADYTTPDMPSYRSSDRLINDIKTFEANDVNGLNGCIVLLHLGTDPKRTDKFYHHLGELLIFLKEKGYSTERFN